MVRAKRTGKMPKKILDSDPPRRGRGRPQTVDPSELTGRADNYREILKQVWEKLWPPLSKAETADDVIAALEYAAPYAADFRPSAGRILAVLKDPKFPVRPQVRINFLADSLGALGRVTPRRSRDICAIERARAQRATSIVRYEYYIECSCGYKGHSERHACPKCAARIQFLPGGEETLSY